MSPSKPVRVLERAIDLIWALAEDSASLSTLASMTNLNKSTAYRILTTMTYRNLVWKDPDTNLYTLGPGLAFLIIRAGFADKGIYALAQGPLQRVSKESGETATLHIRLGDQRVCIAEIPSDSALRYTAGVGSSAPLHVGAAGKAFLAFMPAEDRQLLLERMELIQITANTITDPHRLEEELEWIAEVGYAISCGERVPGASAISVPVFHNEEVQMVLSILGPTSRLPNEVLQSYLPLLSEVANDLSSKLASFNNATRVTRKDAERAGSRKRKAVKAV